MRITSHATYRCLCLDSSTSCGPAQQSCLLSVVEHLKWSFNGIARNAEGARQEESGRVAPADLTQGVLCFCHDENRTRGLPLAANDRHVCAHGLTLRADAPSWPAGCGPAGWTGQLVEAGECAPRHLYHWSARTASTRCWSACNGQAVQCCGNDIINREYCNYVAQSGNEFAPTTEGHVPVVGRPLYGGLVGCQT